MNTLIYLSIFFPQKGQVSNDLGVSLFNYSKGLRLDKECPFIDDNSRVQLPIFFKNLDKISTASQMESLPGIWMKSGLDEDRRLLLTYFLFFTHQISLQHKSQILKSKIFDSLVVPVVCFDKSGSRIDWPWMEIDGQEVLAARSFKFQSGSRKLRTSIDGFRIGLKYDQLFRYLRDSGPNELASHFRVADPAEGK